MTTLLGTLGYRDYRNVGANRIQVFTESAAPPRQLVEIRLRARHQGLQIILVMLCRPAY